MAAAPQTGRPASAPGWLPWAFLALSTLIVAGLAAEPRRTDRMAAVFSPWKSPAAVFAAASRAGAIDAAGGFSNVLIVRSDQPGLAARLRKAGAWALIDADLARACNAPAPAA